MSISIFQIHTNLLLFRVWDFFFLEKAIKQLRLISSQKFAKCQRDTLLEKKNCQKSFCSYCCCSSCRLNIFDYRISKHTIIELLRKLECNLQFPSYTLPDHLRTWGGRPSTSLRNKRFHVNSSPYRFIIFWLLLYIP